ncbi:MAG: arylesterase [Rhizobiaceae bacterium]
MGCKRFALAWLFALALVSAAPARADEIVGFGDSLMAGYGLQPGEGFTDRLQARLAERGHAVKVINGGVSGDTTTGGRERLDWTVPDSAMLVILELGANDMLRGISPAVTHDNLAAMIEALQTRGKTVILAGMRAAPSMGADFQAAFDPIYPELAERYGLALYPFFLEGVAADPALLLADGMHPNAAGIDRMVDGMLPQIEAALAKAKL